MSVASVPRRSLLWLFGGLAAALLPHTGRLPFWVVVVFAVSIAWRLRVHQGRWAFPSWPVRALLVVMACAAVALAYRSLLGLEPAVALLAIAASLKTIELKIQRDFLVVVFAAYFLTASQLLFSQEPYDALYALLGVLVVTAALVARHQGDPAEGFPGPLGLATRMLAQALPLMLILFLVFPRLAPPSVAVHVARDRRDDVESHEIGRAERRALGPADDRSGQGVHLFNGVASLEHRPYHRHDRVASDAVRDEVGGVFGRYRTFTREILTDTRHGREQKYKAQHQRA